MAKGLIDPGMPVALPSRKLTEATCAKWGYLVGEHHGEKVQIANYRDANGTIVAQKVRDKSKDFLFLGNTKEAGLYGQHLWRDGGKMITITEGELDALSVSQAQQNKWPVVSVPNGAQGAKKSLSKALDWLLGFETIVLMFDNDEPGRDAAAACAGLFPPGRCKIATLPLKDASDMLKAGRGPEIIDAIWGAKAYRPDGVVTIDDVREDAMKPVQMGLPWFTKALTELTFGRRMSETYAFGAGTGVGKTDFFTQQITFDLVDLGEPVAVFALEQPVVETVRRVAGKLAGKRFHIPDGSWTTEELATSIDSLGEAGRLFLYDNFGATDWDIIKTTIRFLAHSEGVRLFYLDHLTALAEGADDKTTLLDRIMAEMAALAKELDVIIHFISHLATPEGTPHEEGGRVMIRHFRGSRAIGFWSHFMFGLERNQQHEDVSLQSVTTFRVLKDRYTGNATGQLIYFGYDRDAGRLVELDHNPFETAESHGFVEETSDF